MEDNLISDSQFNDLLTALENETRLPIPAADPDLGKFDIIVHERTAPNYVFKITWGAKNIFIEKSFEPASKDIQTELVNIIKNNAGEIRKELITYCTEQLNNMVLMNFPIEMKKFLPGFFDYKVFVSQCRKKGDKKVKDGKSWPVMSLFVSWDDEGGEFQEFVYPLDFDQNQNCFRIDYPEIIKKFIRYRDSL